jgi:hypothetical protein
MLTSIQHPSLLDMGRPFQLWEGGIVFIWLSQFVFYVCMLCFVSALMLILHQGTAILSIFFPKMQERARSSYSRLNVRRNEARSSSNFTSRATKNSPPHAPRAQTDPEAMETWSCLVVEEVPNFMATDIVHAPPPYSPNVHIASPNGSENTLDSSYLVGSSHTSMEALHS